MTGKRLLSFLAATLALAAASPAAAQDSEPGRVVVVKMLDDRYEPAEIDVQRGDVIHFVQWGKRAHNVEFRSRGAPDGFDFGPDRRGPYFKKQGDIYEVRIDERFLAAGDYPFVCTPHSLMGMKGVIRVRD